ncbi:hypothetical protein [Janthinobacterium sp. BJB446]|uniref:hypothetical protein n=1 Tax=Janthinobacterium sp. BJB446 TaxID=2048009 RepID=UPI00117BC70E|nr:hypothetical protein [Janthinobacterium sp. BJB446]
MINCGVRLHSSYRLVLAAVNCFFFACILIEYRIQIPAFFSGYIPLLFHLFSRLFLLAGREMVMVWPVLALLACDADAAGQAGMLCPVSCGASDGWSGQRFFVTRCKTLFLLDKFGIGYGWAQL